MQNLIYNWLGANQELFSIINYTLNLYVNQWVWHFLEIAFSVLAFLIYYSITASIVLYQLKAAKASWQSYCATFEKLATIGAMFSAICICYALAKFSINMPRPFCSGINFFSSKSFAQVRCLSSFPSAHTAMATLLCYILWPYLKLYAKLGAVLLLVSVALSRIALAMHFPADVVYSIFICLAIIQIAQRAYKLKFLQIWLIRPIEDLIYEKLVLTK